MSPTVVVFTLRLYLFLVKLLLRISPDSAIQDPTFYQCLTEQIPIYGYRREGTLDTEQKENKYNFLD